MKSIKLPVLFLNDNDLELTELGIKSESDCVPEIIGMLFYNIDAISHITHRGQKCTCIYSGGTEFISPLSIYEVQQILEAY